MNESRDLQNDLIFRSLSSPGELFDFSGLVLRNVAKPLLSTLIGPCILFVTSLMLLGSIILPYFFVTTKTSVADQALEILVFGLGGLILFVLISCVLFAFVGAVISEAAWSFVMGASMRPADWIGKVSARLWPLIGATLRVVLPPFLYCLIGFALVMAPGAVQGQETDSTLGWITVLGIFWCLLGLAFVPMLTNVRALAPVIVLREEGGVARAVKRAKELSNKAPGALVKGSLGYTGRDLLNNVWGIVILTLFFGLIIAASVLSEMTGIESLTPGQEGSWTEIIFSGFVAVAPFFVAIIALQLIWNVSCTVLYLDRRIQLEGFDVILLKERTGRARSTRYEV